jgi:protein disulfide-isomerase
MLAALGRWAGAEEMSWLTDFAKAQAQAKTEKKLVLMDFNGSDWCPPCKALRKNVLSTPEFAEFAKKNLVLLDVDFPRTRELDQAQQKANETLATKYDIEIFPTLVVLNGEGKQLQKTMGYVYHTPKAFIADLEKLLKASK